MRVLIFLLSLTIYTNHAIALEFGCNLLHMTGNYSKAMDRCRIEAKEGNAESAKLVAQMYQDGQGVQKNEALARAWKRIAKKLEEETTAILANAKSESDFMDICQGKIKNLSLIQMNEACMKLALEGNSLAQYQLAWSYESGLGAPESRDEAAKWFKLSAEGGNRDAQYIVATKYSESPIAQQAWLIKAAKQGHIHAQHDLALYYQDSNPEKSIYLFQQLTNRPAKHIGRFSYLLSQEDEDNYFIVDASYRLAELYKSGRGVLQNFDQAARWIKRAAELGHIQAQAALSHMYIEGQGVPKNLVMAHAWLNRAASLGHKQAAVERDSLASRMTPVQIKAAQELAKKLP